MIKHSNIKYFLFILICCAAFSFTGYSAAVAKPRLHETKLLSAKIKLIEAWIQTKIKHDFIPGIAVSVFDKETVIWEKGFGYADLDNNTKMTPDTPMRVCSISKLFTALMIMQLSDKGDINIEHNLKNYLPKFNPKLDGRVPQTSLTLKQILTHTSGLPTEADMPYFIDMNYPSSKRLLQDINSRTLLAEPGTQFRYSNLGYSLAGLVIENVTTESFNKIVQQSVIKPLNLQNTYTDISLMNDPKQLGHGYGIRQPGGREKFRTYVTNALSPAAGLISSGHDLSLLGSWMINESNNTIKVVEPKTKINMMQPAWQDPVAGNNRGLGFRYYKDKEKDYIGHGGYCSGYRAVLMVDASMQNGISVIMNVNDESPYDIAFTIMNIINMEFDEKHTETQPDLAQYEGVYDRAGMPIRSAIVALPNRLLVMDMFAQRPDENIWILTPSTENPKHFKKEGETIEGDIYFRRSQSNSKMQFHRYYNYLTRNEMLTD